MRLPCSLGFIRRIPGLPRVPWEIKMDGRAACDYDVSGDHILSLKISVGDGLIYRRVVTTSPSLEAIEIDDEYGLVRVEKAQPQ